MNRELMNVGRTEEGNEIGISEIQHMAFFGMTGAGKSLLFFLMLIGLILRGVGFCLIDGGGDLAKRIAAWVKQNWEKIPPFVRRKIYWVEVSHEWNVSLDPFDVGGTGTEYITRLTTRVHKVMRDIVRGSDDFSLKDTPLLEKWLVNTLWVCAVEYEPGKRLGLHKALDVLRVEHPHWAEAFLKMLPFVPDDVVSDFYELRAMSANNRQWERGSAVRKLRRFLTPLVKSMFESTKPRLDVRKVIQEGGIILCDIAPTLDCSIEQSTTIGGLIQTEVMDAMETTRPTERQPFILAIDEAEHYLGEDTGLYLARSRKWGGACWLGFQNLASLMSRMESAVHKVISQVQVLCTFQQRDPTDLEILKKVFGYSMLDFTPHLQPMALPNGQEWVVVESETNGKTDTVSWNHSVTDGTSDTVTNARSHAVAQGANWSNGSSEGQSFGLAADQREGTSSDKTVGSNESESASWNKARAKSTQKTDGSSDSQNTGWTEAKSQQQGIGKSLSETEKNPHRTKVKNANASTGTSEGESGGSSSSVQRSNSTGTNESDGVGGQKSKGNTVSQREGVNASAGHGTRQTWSTEKNGSAGGSVTQTNTVSESHAHGVNHSVTEGEGGSEAITNSKTRTPVPIQKYDKFLWPSGKLDMSVDDQLHKLAHRMSTFGVGECLLLGRTGRAQYMKVNHVHEIGCPLWCEALTNSLKEEVFGLHDCYFVPKLELKQWQDPGKKKSTGSRKRSGRTPGQQGNSFGRDSSPLDRLDNGHSNGSVKKEEKPDA